MIGILILNYKKYQVTADCIRSVLDTGDGLDYHIYVLDNGSGNDSIACLQAQFPNNPRITWMESAENTGYARGNNQMLSRARKDGCTAAVITNSDIVFLPDTLQQLAADIAEGHPIVGPRLQYPNGQRQNSVKLRPYTYREYLWTETYLRNLVPKAKLQALRRQPAAPGEVYWLSGAVFAVDTAVFHRLGDFDPYTFLYYEEYILSARCKAQNIARWCCKPIYPIGEPARRVILSPPLPALEPTPTGHRTPGALSGSAVYLWQGAQMGGCPHLPAQKQNPAEKGTNE